jgi:hypothetical protein
VRLSPSKHCATMVFAAEVFGREGSCRHVVVKRGIETPELIGSLRQSMHGCIAAVFVSPLQR